MAKFYNVLYPRPYLDKDKIERSEFIRVGRAFPLKDSKGLSVQINTLPVNIRGDSLSLVILPQEERAPGSPEPASAPVDDDDIPF